MNLRPAFLLFGILIAFNPHIAYAAAITVEGECTLVDAINAANNDQASGGCPAGNGDDVITLTGDVILTEAYQENGAPSGLPNILSVVEINGNGFSIRRDVGSPPFNIFIVGKEGSLTLNDVTISGGHSQDNWGGGITTIGSLLINNSTLSDNNTDNSGGAIAMLGGHVTIRSSIIENNQAESGSAIAAGALFSDGILEISHGSIIRNNIASGNTSATIATFLRGPREGEEQPKVNITITDSIIQANKAIFAIHNVGTLVMSRNTISGNEAGGLYNQAQATIENSTISDNIGSGVVDSANFRANAPPDTVLSTTIVDSTISENSDVGVHAFFSSFIIRNSTIANNMNGGMYIGAAIVDLSNVTISGNSKAEGDGAGINIQGHNGPGHLTITNSTIVGNTVAQGRWGYGIDSYLYNEITIINTVILNHDVRDCSHFDSAFVTGHNNLSNNSLCPGSSVIHGLDDTLRDNGGATMTIALLEGSNAVDAGDPSVCPETDQRGATRIGTCDIGAYEFGGEIDSDSDGVLDGADVCPAVVNTDQADTDQDGVGDACDQCLNTTGTSSGSGCPDGDADTIPDTIDNCPSVANTDQTDLNNDKTGDACQDSDEDSFTDSIDLCPMIIGTAAGCPDKDEDEVPDESDVCPDAPGLAETNGCLFTGTVNGTKNLRSGPGTNFEIVDQIETDQSFALLGRNDTGDWLRIRLDNGFEAWIATTLVITTTPLDEIPIVES